MGVGAALSVLLALALTRKTRSVNQRALIVTGGKAEAARAIGGLYLPLKMQDWACGRRPSSWRKLKNQHPRSRVDCEWSDGVDYGEG